MAQTSLYLLYQKLSDIALHYLFILAFPIFNYYLAYHKSVPSDKL